LHSPFLHSILEKIMNAVQLLREQFASAHETQEATMSDVNAKAADFAETGKALPVGAAYAHLVVSEDMLLAGMITHSTPLSADNALTGLSTPMPSMSEWDKHEEWVRTVKVDVPKMQAFAKKVYKQTDDYLATLKDSDLENEVEIPGMGKKTLSFLLTNFLLLHIANLTGEISAVKGVQGLKGYPF